MANKKSDKTPAINQIVKVITGKTLYHKIKKCLLQVKCQ
jgi:hypothetical protein